MNFAIIDAEQRSPEWFQARLGRLTSSTAAEAMAKIKSGEWAASRRNLRIRLALERITGRSLDRDNFQSRAMQDGIDREPDAYGVYEALTGRLLERTGFLQHTELMAGCSLDGSCDDFAGIIEIKSPEHSAHLEYLRTGIVPWNYLKQVTHALWVTGAQWCDWLSYQPDFPEGLNVKLVRIERDDAVIADYDAKARAFLAEVSRDVDAVMELKKAVA